MDVVPLYL